MAGQQGNGVTAEKVRAASAFLLARNIRPEQLSARTFAAAAEEVGKSLMETLRLLGVLMTGGQAAAERRKDLIIDELNKA